MYIQNIFIISTCILCIQGFDIKVMFCRFRCSKSSERTGDQSNPAGDTKTPTDYYWRDFYGIIPTDAYPIGPSTQFPQTYIAQVFDPSKNGTFVTTIYDGLNYVYTVLNNETTKIDKHIQILCTQSPGQLSWVKLTSQNIKTMTASQKPVIGGYHAEPTENGHKIFYHYIVKTNKCSITYTGAVFTLNTDLEYAVIDGTSESTDQFLWLMYKEKEPENDPENSGPSTSKSFFSHQYAYKIQPNSIIPMFYKQFTIGSCSITCTNEDQSSLNKFQTDEKLSASMAYYWKPNSVISKDEAIVAGNKDNSPLYIGQSYSTVNLKDVGYSNLKWVSIELRYNSFHESRYYHILSSNYPEKFKWVNTTAEDFSYQDHNKMIPGGAFYNGTETFVCREVDETMVIPGSARESKTDGTYCYAMIRPAGNFQVLMFDPKNKF